MDSVCVDSSNDKVGESEGIGVHGERDVNAVIDGCERQSAINMSADEEDLVIRMHKLVGDRWSLIAGRIPGRTAEEVERYWKSRMESEETRTRENAQAVCNRPQTSYYIENSPAGSPGKSV